jgi:hypothetical protein
VLGVLAAVLALAVCLSCLWDVDHAALLPLPTGSYLLALCLPDPRSGFSIVAVIAP